jgi:hypothetical protein
MIVKEWLNAAGCRDWNGDRIPQETVKIVASVPAFARAFTIFNPVEKAVILERLAEAADTKSS